MTATTTPATPVGPPTDERRAQFRTDIQGLRAIAVLLVLGYHAGLSFLPGGYVGVDVFFVISGFLITGLIIREIERTGRLDLARFYARRARRLLPAATIVLIATAALAFLALPITRWRDIAGDIIGSTVYLVNWRLAERSVDYLAAESAASPVQHFWSLAVEEQFYILWPVTILVVVAIARRRWSLTTRLTTGLLALGVPSLVWSIYLTETDPGPAYFVSTTRVWELVIGALLAVHAHRAKNISDRSRGVLGWAGLALIGYAAVTFDATTPFPGASALVPTIGTAAVLLAGTGSSERILRPLRLHVMQDVGALSYSLYLWHWPLLVAAQAIWGREDGSLWTPTGLMVVAASAVPAWFTYRAIEGPLHHARPLATPRRALVLAVLCAALSVGAAAALFVAADRAEERAERRAESIETLGAGLFSDEGRPATPPELPTSVDGVVPALTEAPEDVADVYDDGCHQDQVSAEVLSCTYGDEDSDTVIALVGDSHAAHWQPALRQAAEDHSWRLDTFTKSSCLYGDVPVWLGSVDGPYTSCYTWQSDLTDRLIELGPDVVIVGQTAYAVAENGSQLSVAESFDAVADAMARNWTRLEDAGIEVIAIVDTPWWPFDVPECIAQNENDLENCVITRDEGMEKSEGSRLIPEAVSRAPGVTAVELTNYFCPGENCYPVIGNVITFSDRHHVSATYSRTLAPVLAHAIERETG